MHPPGPTRRGRRPDDGGAPPRGRAGHRRTPPPTYACEPVERAASPGGPGGPADLLVRLDPGPRRVIAEAPRLAQRGDLGGHSWRPRHQPPSRDNNPSAAWSRSPASRDGQLAGSSQSDEVHARWASPESHKPSVRITPSTGPTHRSSHPRLQKPNVGPIQGTPNEAPHLGGRRVHMQP
jgi:hypothetical protein